MKKMNTFTNILATFVALFITTAVFGNIHDTPPTANVRVITATPSYDPMDTNAANDEGNGPGCQNTGDMLDVFEEFTVPGAIGSGTTVVDIAIDNLSGWMVREIRDSNGNTIGGGNGCLLLLSAGSTGYSLDNGEIYEVRYFDWDGDGNQAVTFETSYSSAGALSIELKDQYVTIDDFTITATAEIAAQVNASHLVLEHSPDNSNWKEIARDDLQGTTHEASFIQLSYTYNDPQDLVPVMYYRWVQYDYDGKFERFKVMAGKFDRLEEVLFVESFSPSGKIHVTNYTNKDLTLHVFSIEGELVTRQIMVNGVNEVYSPLPNGQYAYIFIRNDKIYESQRVTIIQR